MSATVSNESRCSFGLWEGLTCRCLRVAVFTKVKYWDKLPPFPSAFDLDARFRSSCVILVELLVSSKGAVLHLLSPVYDFDWQLIGHSACDSLCSPGGESIFGDVL